MQMFYSVFSFMIIIQALLVQSIWLMLGRKARNRYLSDIMHFRNPSSSLSRYYGWRTDSFANAIVEGVLLEFILVGSLIVLSLLLASIEALFSQSLIILFVVVLTFLSSLQLAWRVREIAKAENRLIDSIKPARDKIGIARDIIENLYSQGEMGDGRVWFALFRLSTRPDQVGWAIRDVLMEKSKEEQEKAEKVLASQDKTDKGIPGPSIE
ncbi:ABC transporter ATP-binding protein [Candidatus Thorarchaeota archaeon]|nr:MAG: ABC transporter ATP-binding protein [Candidatus Thorarchaeota archaeon]